MKIPHSRPILISFGLASTALVMGALLLLEWKGGTAATESFDWVSHTLEVQRELPANIMLSVGYVGNHGTHLLGELFRSFNYVHTADVLKYKGSLGAVIPITDVYSGKTAQLLQQVYGTPDLPRSLLLKPYPFYALGLGANTAWDGTAHYNSMDVQVRKRFSGGLSFVAAYTWSKAMDNGLPGQLGANVVDPVHFARPGYVGGRAGTGSFGNQTGGLYQDRDHIVDKTISADDIPQMFNIAGSYELPFGKGKMFLNQKGPLNLLFGGWMLTGNFNAQSGIPMSIGCPGNNVTSRCNLIGNPKFSGSRSRQQEIAQWFNPAAFQPPFGGDQTGQRARERRDHSAEQQAEADVAQRRICVGQIKELEVGSGRGLQRAPEQARNRKRPEFNSKTHQPNVAKR